MSPLRSRYAITPSVRKEVRKQVKRTPKVALIDRPLTRQQEKFCMELVYKDGQITLREAAQNAGYAMKSAHVRASELTNPDKYPHVVKRIHELRAEVDAIYGVNYHRHQRELYRIREQALGAGAYSAAVQAEKARGQAEGSIYIAKSEVRHGTIDSMDRDQVLKALDEIKNSYDPVTYGNGDTGGRRRTKTRERLLEADQIESAEEVDRDEAGDVGDEGGAGSDAVRSDGESASD